MVGASLAVGLAAAGRRVAIVEGVAPDAATQPSFDDRSIALAHGSRRIFGQLGLWAEVEPATAAIHRIHVSDRGRFGSVRLDHREEGVPALGYVVPTRALGRILRARLARAEGVDWFCPARLEAIEHGEGHVRCRLRHTDGAGAPGETRVIETRLLVGADGAESVVRRALGGGVERREYGQSAVIANVVVQRPHGGTAYERFTPTGPVALLPLPGGEGRHASLVWTVPAGEEEAYLALDDAGFLARLQDRFGYRLGRFEAVGRRHAYPLRLIRARESTGPRTALLGNAAHTLHPIAGQGFNLGIRDVAVLLGLLERMGAEDPGAPELLEAYAAWRRADHRNIIRLTDLLARLFTLRLAPVVWGRDLGLVLVDTLPPLKHWLARQTMGLGTRIPRPMAPVEAAGHV